MNFPKDVEWMDKKARNKKGIIRLFAYSCIFLYVIGRGATLLLVMIISFPVMWLKEKTI